MINNSSRILLNSDSTSKGPKRNVTQSKFDVGDHHGINLDLMKRDITEKDKQIATLILKISKTTIAWEKTIELINDLETSIGLELVPEDRKKVLATASPLELSTYLKEGLKRLIQIHSETQQTYIQDFELHANEITESIQTSEDQIQSIQKALSESQSKQKLLDRQISILEKERKSLNQISNDFDKENKERCNSFDMFSFSIQEQISKIKKDTRNIKGQTKQRAKRNFDVTQNVNAPPSKYQSDIAAEDEQLNEEIAVLQERLDREVADHEDAKDELHHVLSEIERAHEIINKFKETLNKDSQKEANKINANLRKMIDQQREDSKWKISNQQKRNRELDKQRQELVEEENYLRPYLQSVEKKLAAQMLVLPSISVLQHRDQIPQPQKPEKKRRVKVQMDDAEMRAIKKTMAKMRQQRERARTSLY